MSLYKDGDLRLRVSGFEGQGVFDGHGAADAAAKLFGGSHAQDHHQRAGNLAGVPIPEEALFEFHLGEDVRVAAVTVFRAVVLAPAGGQDGGAMLDAQASAIPNAGCCW